MSDTTANTTPAADHKLADWADFDAAAFRTWLDSTGDDGHKVRDTDPYLSISYDNYDGEPGWLAAAVLSSIEDHDNRGWKLADGVQVALQVLADAEGGDDGVLVEVLVDGQWLSAGRIAPHNLIPVDDDQKLPGYEAAIIAMENIAETVNSRIRHFRTLVGEPVVAEIA